MFYVLIGDGSDGPVAAVIGPYVGPHAHAESRSEAIRQSAENPHLVVRITCVCGNYRAGDVHVPDAVAPDAYFGLTEDEMAGLAEQLAELDLAATALLNGPSGDES